LDNLDCPHPRPKLHLKESIANRLQALVQFLSGNKLAPNGDKRGGNRLQLLRISTSESMGSTLLYSSNSSIAKRPMLACFKTQYVQPVSLSHRTSSENRSCYSLSPDAQVSRTV
jgi:hypothetical protein